MCTMKYKDADNTSENIQIDILDPHEHSVSKQH